MTNVASSLGCCRIHRIQGMSGINGLLIERLDLAYLLQPRLHLARHGNDFVEFNHDSLVIRRDLERKFQVFAMC